MSLDIFQSALFSAVLRCSKVHSYGSQNSNFMENKYLRLNKLCTFFLAVSRELCQVIYNPPGIKVNVARKIVFKEYYPTFSNAPD